MSSQKKQSMTMLSEKVNILTKFEALLHKIYFKYKNVIDSEYKDEYNQLCREYNHIFQPKGKTSRPERRIAENTYTNVGHRTETIHMKAVANTGNSSSEMANVEVKSTTNPQIKVIVIRKDPDSGLFDPKEVEKVYSTSTSQIELTSSSKEDECQNEQDDHNNHGSAHMSISTDGLFNSESVIDSNDNPIHCKAVLNDTNDTNDTNEQTFPTTSTTILEIVPIDSNPSIHLSHSPRTQRKMQWKKINTTSVMNKYFNPQTKTFDCPFEWCERRVYPDKEKLRFHMYNIHTDKQLPCPFEGCGKLFKNKDRLRSHQMIHTNSYPVQCEYPNCDYRCRSNFALRDHIQRVHQTEQSYKCMYYKCGRVFNSEAYLKRHQKCHSTEPMFKCKVEGCHQRFHTCTQLTKHKVSDHNQLIACEWPGCDYRHHSKFVIKEHRRVHTGEKPFICQWTDCHKSFRTKVNLKLHLKVHEKNSTESEKKDQ